jgi:hypothetical protein
MVYISADDPPHRSPADLARLRAAANGPIDTSDIPESTGPVHRVHRDAQGRLPRKPPSLIRDAILAQLGHKHMTRYELWKRARRHCPTLPQSAVYEYLAGARQIGATYLDALLQAADLKLVAAA